MANLQEKVLGTIKKYKLIEAGDKIVLGVSGGPDSMCLLSVLNTLIMEENVIFQDMCKGLSPVTKVSQKAPSQMTKKAPSLVVAHVNHMIREEATADEEYVRNYCKKNNIEFYSKSIDVRKLANNNKIGTEEAGRAARYEFFNEVLKQTNSNKIAIAHNMNDKAETIIMNLMRGSGVTGLKGIEPKRDNIIRPLIECERVEIEEYCKENNLEPRIDKTNFENIYTRNKIRNVVIPYIKEEFNPNIVNTLNRLSNLVTEEEQYVEKQVEKAYKNVIIEEQFNVDQERPSPVTKVSQKAPSQMTKKAPSPMAAVLVLDLKKFNAQEKVIKSKLVLYTITRVLGDSQGIEKVHIDDIIKLCSNNIGNKYLTPNKRIKILVKNHKIYFLSQV